MTYYKIFCKMHRRTDYGKRRNQYVEIMRAVLDPDYFKKQYKSRKELEKLTSIIYAPMAYMAGRMGVDPSYYLDRPMSIMDDIVDSLYGRDKEVYGVSQIIKSRLFKEEDSNEQQILDM